MGRPWERDRTILEIAPQRVGERILLQEENGKCLLSWRLRSASISADEDGHGVSVDADRVAALQQFIFDQVRAQR